jgi:hypothetical protein
VPVGVSGAADGVRALEQWLPFGQLSDYPIPGTGTGRRVPIRCDNATCRRGHGLRVFRFRAQSRCQLKAFSRAPYGGRGTLSLRDRD